MHLRVSVDTACPAAAWQKEALRSTLRRRDATSLSFFCRLSRLEDLLLQREASGAGSWSGSTEEGGVYAK